MYLTVFTGELRPFTTAGASRIVEGLTGHAARQGWRVDVFMPRPAVMSPDLQIPLARRLNRIAGSKDGQGISFARYDGKLPSGVSITLLDAEAAVPPSPAALGFAAATLLETAAPRPEVILVVDDAFVLPANASGYGTQLRFLTGLHQGVGGESTLRTIVYGLGVARALERAGGPMGQALASGRAFAMPTVWDKELTADGNRHSRRAGTQLSAGLPVRTVPVCLVESSLQLSVETIAGMLTHDVQLIVEPSRAEEFASLAQEYPDRLALLPGGTSAATILAGCDFCFCANGDQVRQCLSMGVIPIAAATAGGDVIPFDPRLESGNGYVFESLDVRALKAVLGDAITGFHRMSGASDSPSHTGDRVVDWQRNLAWLEELVASGV